MLDFRFEPPCAAWQEISAKGTDVEIGNCARPTSCVWKLIKQYRVECRSHWSGLEFALSSCARVDIQPRSHIKFTTESRETRASRGDLQLRQYTYRAEYSDHRVRSLNTVYSSWHRDCFAVLISKMVNALEAAAKNERGRAGGESSVAF